MSDPLFDSVRDLLLHRPPMLFLRRLSEWSETTVSAEVDPADSAILADAHGQVPAWVGIEYMAQMVSAFAGIDNLRRGREPQLGLLLGSRRYQSRVASFAPGQRLRVEGREIYRDENNLVLFDCRIFDGEEELVSAEVKALQPEKLSDIIPEFE